MSVTITDVTGLQAMNTDRTEDYVLGNNIDATDTTTWNAGNGFLPIGDHTNKFTGSFNGAGYTIKNLFMSRTGADYIAFFGELNGATIQNVILESPSITGDQCVGVIAGYAGGSSTISNITVTSPTVSSADSSGDVGGVVGFSAGSTISDVAVTGGTVSGVDYVGGVIGYSYQDDVDDCHATCAVTATDDSAGGFAGYGYESNFASCYATGATKATDDYGGGFIGRDESSTFTSCYATGAITGTYGIAGFIGSFAGSTISKCYATGNVTAIAGTGYGLGGGFAARTLAADGSITDCYARGTVDCDDVADFDIVGGFIGYLQASCTVTNCYSSGAPTGDDDVGGFCGSNSGTITSCYWDTTTSGEATSDGGIGATTAQMNYQLTFTDWDFVSTWAIDSSHNNNYPYLGVGGVIGRCYTISDLFDEKGRVPKGARVLAYRSDTHELIKEGTIDANGNATICGLPLDTDVSFHVTWGGATSGENNRWFYSDISGVVEGGTGSSTAPGGATNLGLGTGDSPHFTAVNVGHATDTTVARESAGKLSVEGKVLVRPAACVVAANNSYIKTQADYTCDGTDD